MSLKEDLICPTKLHCKIMQKYRDFFNKILTCKVISFGCDKCLANNQLMLLSDDVKFIELFIESQGHKDSPFLQGYKNITTGYNLVWDGYSKDNIKHNTYQHLLSQELGVDLTFLILERHSSYSQYFCFDLNVPGNNLSLQEKINIALQDFLNNMILITACLNQFKTEFLANKVLLDLFKVNIKGINDSIVTAQPQINKDKLRIALETGILTKDDLYLKNIQLTTKEETCLSLYASGISMHEVAEKLALSPRTVEGYLGRLKEKMDANTKSDLLEKFSKLKLIMNLNL